MSVTTLEGIVKDGRVMIPEGIELPESTRVFVIVPDMNERGFRMASPRLVDPSRITEFKRKVTEIDDDEI